MFLLNQRNPLISGSGAEGHCQSADPESGREISQACTTHSKGLNLDRQVAQATSEMKSGQAGSTSLNNSFRWTPVCATHTSGLGRVNVGTALKDTSLTDSRHPLDYCAVEALTSAQPSTWSQSLSLKEEPCASSALQLLLDPFPGGM